ncbi:MAG TPA: radical SAM protein [Fibrobacteraceae bacterium]|nr:radical SAM protein [Fibrobacteraceae bacterium]
MDSEDNSPSYKAQNAILFVIFNKPEQSARCFERIRAMQPTRLYIASDGPRTGRSGEELLVAQTRKNVLDRVDWTCDLHTRLQEANLGCKEGVASAIDWVFETEQAAIILEDDCLASTSFFRFCDEMLERYAVQTDVMHVTGNNFQDGIRRGEASYYFSQLPHVWGWATWRRAWRHYRHVEQNAEAFIRMAQSQRLSHFPEATQQVIKNAQWAIETQSTWDYLWHFTIRCNNGLVVTPQANLVTNVGIGVPGATHTTTDDSTQILPQGKLDFPLHHPDRIKYNPKADNVYYRKRWGMNISPLHGVHPKTSLPVGVPLPQVIQFPLTQNCNSHCKMCNIWNMPHSKPLSVERLQAYLADLLFSQVRYVGINGGEPTMLNNLVEITDEIMRLPNLRCLNMISNALLPRRLLEVTQTIQAHAKKKGLLFDLSLSLDGCESMNDFVRGTPGSFLKVMQASTEIMAHPGLFCNQFTLGCTVSRHNVYHMVELDAFAKRQGLPLFYRLAVQNKRIETSACPDFSVLSDPSTLQAATEFFYELYRETRDPGWRGRYFSLFRYLESGGKIRLSPCDWRHRDVTLDWEGNLYYCATESRCIGNLNDIDTGVDIFYSPENLRYRELEIGAKCSSCIHYAFELDPAGKQELRNEESSQSHWASAFKKALS